MNLTGPYWIDNDPYDDTKEYSPQEAFFAAELPNATGRVLRIAAQNNYQVWLNGEWLGYGPLQAPHGILTVDEWSIPDHGEEKTDLIEIQVFWEGLFLFDKVRGTPGLWLGLEANGIQLDYDLAVNTKTGRIVNHRFSRQRGWGEIVDGRERVAHWSRGSFSKDDWQKPILRTVDKPVTLEPRDVKPFATVERKAEQVTFAGSCDPAQRITHRSLSDDDDAGDASGSDVPARVIQEERILPSRATDYNQSSLTSSGCGYATLSSDPDGFDRTVQLDFDVQTTGLIEIELEAPEGTVVDFGWSEALWDEELMNCWARSSQPNGSIPSRELCDSRQAVRYICKGGGTERYTSLLIATFRYLRVAFRCPPENRADVKIRRLICRTIGYPILREGSFRCPDQTLNRIYDAACITMENSICDAFLDCPGRERAGWLNDSYWANLGFSAVTGDWQYDRRFLRQFFVSQDVIGHGGIVAPNYPSDGCKWRMGGGNGQPPIVGQSLFWLLQMERHLRLYGDDILKGEWKRPVERLFEVFAKHRSAEGFLENPPWDHFLDWSHSQAGGINTADNFLYGFTLSKLGVYFDNSEWQDQGRETLNAVNTYAWNGDRRLYADLVVRENGLGPGSEFGATNNYVALWTGAVPADRAEIMWRRLRNFHPMTLDTPLFSYENQFTCANLYGQLYRFDLAGRLGETDCLIRDIKETYVPMLERGQTGLGEHLGFESSLCHGLNGFAAHVLAKYVAGIHLPENSNEVIQIRPQPATLSWCQARVPWIEGHVQVWWSKTSAGLEVIASVPNGQRGEIVLRDGRSKAFDGSISAAFEI